MLDKFPMDLNIVVHNTLQDIVQIIMSEGAAQVISAAAHQQCLHMLAAVV